MQFAIDIALSLIYFGLFLLVLAWTWRFWLMYKQLNHWNNLKWVMLELKLPRNIEKSPLASELGIHSLFQTGGMGTRFHRLFQGNLPQFASLEIASIEGILHFYVRVQARYRQLVESTFYAQYPGIEIIEVQDYTRLIRYHHLSKNVSMYGAQYKLSKEEKPFKFELGQEDVSMPADFWPIKTYVDYGLDQNPKPEHVVDPIANMLEFMGAIRKGEHFWFQILVTDASNFNNKKWPALYVNPRTHEHMDIMKLVDAMKKTIRTAGINKKGDKAKDKYGYVEKRTIGRDAEGKPIEEVVTYQEDQVVTKAEVALTPDEKGMIEMLNRKISKPLGHVVIRLLYVAESEAFNPQNIFNILSWGKPFESMNKFGFTTTDPYDYPWQNPKKQRDKWRAEEMFEEYVEREGFFPHIPPRPWLDKWEDSIFWSSSMRARKTFRMFIESFFWPFDHPTPKDVSTLNLEEIATLWHLPGPYITTPTLPRIETTAGLAPVNLPQ